MKLRIYAFKNGINIGFVKSVSYKTGTYKLTKDKMFAKTYSSHDKASSDVDVIAYCGISNGVVFSIDF